MPNYKIYPLRIGYFEGLELSTLTIMQNQGVKIKAPLIMYLIKNNDDMVLVDTGGSDEAWSSKYHTKIIRTPDEEPRAALKGIGVNYEDIKYVVNTHLHWDHCFNNDLFCNAKIYVQRKEIEYATNPKPAHYKFYEATQLGFTPKWMVARDSIVEVDGEYDLLPGIKLIPLPGHSPGFQGVLVDTEQGRYLIASDTVGLSSNIEGENIKNKIATGIYCNLDDSYESLDKISTLADFVLPGHDPSVFNQKVYP